MFGKKNRDWLHAGPFSHADGCRVLRADPTIVIEWQRIEGRRWQRICECGTETVYEPVPSRVQPDPYDPVTSRHLPQCEFKDASDPAIVRAALRVKPGAHES